MEKEFTIKIYKQRARAHYPEFVRDFWAGYFKNTAFRVGRAELIRIANCDLAGGIIKSSEANILEEIANILEEIKAINSGSNNYYYDGTDYFFKVFSRKCKN